MTTFYEFASEALHIFNFENFLKSMTSCLSELKVTPIFCIGFKIHDIVTATNKYQFILSLFPDPRFKHCRILQPFC